ncbi:trans-aconitate 2-methyltransferase [Aestuariivirga litoralis]|uniref:trans-aconitate 2-methyltransferase n=1 Tax=Aestuariivirga litoralis TaxID=2650924 RepID=UPI0018C81574|nr:trans-aconitate 2-methyltransferase [Aestuariivirga litoralis]
MPSWNPAQYLKFADERTRAARDLLAQVPLKDPALVYDLGCGPGNSTELLVEAYPAARIVGMDSSPDMLAQARKALPQVTFEQGDLAAWQPSAQADLLYSNATFQWVPDHVGVLQRLLSRMKPGAVLAVQMPDNRREPSHVAMEQASEGRPYAAKLAGKARGDIPTPAQYYAALKPACEKLDIFHIIYNFPLAGAAAVVEWVKGTGLRPFVEALTAEEQADYLSRYQRLIAMHYPEQEDGKVLLRFPRIFMVAQK